jgi:hypothetical protein
MEFGLSGASADTLEGVSTWIAPGLVIFWVANCGTPLYLNPYARVNTILTHFLRPPPPRAIGRRETTTTQRDAAAWTRSSAIRSETDRSRPVG